MKRRTLDIMFSVGGVALAGLLFVLGAVMVSNANFAKDYTHDQLAAQKIVFKDKAALTPEEAQSSCLNKYAGQLLTTGKQAECYANDFVALHLSEQGAGTPYAGMTYAELGKPQTDLRNQVKAATAAKDPNLPTLQKQLDTITTQRTTTLNGETIRGLLLTSYGFSVFGVKGGQVAIVAFIVGGLLLLLSLAGFWHAFRTPATVPFAEPEHVPAEPVGTRLAGA
jgi:hypothetical protein